MSADLQRVTDAARGDRAAFAGLYDAWSRPVFAFLVGLLRRREDAEDVLHDAFLAAWTRLPSLRDADRFAPWLFQIARNAALSRRRRAPAQPLAHEPLAPAVEPPGDAGAVGAALLAALDPDTRAVLLLRYVVGWSVEETAGALGTSPATVKRRAAAGLERLRLRLERSTP